MKHPHSDVLRSWLAHNPGIFAFEEREDGVLLMEVFSGKQRDLRDMDIDRIEQLPNRETGKDYVIVLTGDGVQIVLAQQGFAFAPDFRNTGPLPVPTSVFCMKDFEHIAAQIEQADPQRKRETVELIMVLISLLDGARNVGLEVGSEERRVERMLAAAEATQS